MVITDHEGISDIPSRTILILFGLVRGAQQPYISRQRFMGMAKGLVLQWPLPNRVKHSDRICIDED